MDKLQFYARSADRLAGSGVGDQVEDPTIYERLNRITHWRRMFSSLWDGENISYEDRTYRSFEHAFQAQKFLSAGYRKTAFSFCLESNSILANGTGLDAFKARKAKILSEAKMENWNIIKDDVKMNLYRAKYARGTMARKALLRTKNAELWNAGPRIQKIRCFSTETIREEIFESIRIKRSKFKT
jgi:predicted NAD-dependent protein-ADP-ribosyltransferase YbiA (DUF1768 family)